jgi:aspartate kinase
MLVMKFGGTSVGKPERMKKIGDLLLSTPGKKIVVLSALSGTTNALVSIGDFVLLGQKAKAEDEIAKLEKHYQQFVKDLYSTDGFQAIGKEIVSRFFIFNSVLSGGHVVNKNKRQILTQSQFI